MNNLIDIKTARKKGRSPFLVSMGFSLGFALLTGGCATKGSKPTLLSEPRHAQIILWGMTCDKTASWRSDDLHLDVSGRVGENASKGEHIDLGNWTSGQSNEYRKIVFEADVYDSVNFVLSRESSWPYLAGTTLGALWFQPDGTIRYGRSVEQPESGPRPTGETLFRIRGEDSNYLIAVKAIWGR